jgi:hypothetical protein
MPIAAVGIFMTGARLLKLCSGDQQRLSGTGTLGSEKARMDTDEGVANRRNGGIGYHVTIMLQIEHNQKCQEQV